MFAAVSSGSLSTLELVIPSVASVDPRDSLGRTPLHFALQTDAPPQIIRLLTKRCDLESRDGRGGTLLHSCVRGLSRHGLAIVLDATHGRLLKMRDFDGKTALERAVEADWAEGAGLLFEEDGAGGGDDDDDGLGLAGKCVGCGAARCLDGLLKRGRVAAAIRGDAEVGGRLVFQAIEANEPLCLALLLEARAPADREAGGLHPAQAAAAAGSRDSLAMLFFYGARAHFRSAQHPLSPLELAVRGGHEGCVDLLLDLEVPVGVNALALAVAGGRTTIAALLISRGAVAVPAAGPEWLLHACAEAGGDRACVDMLLSEGCDPLAAREGAEGLTAVGAMAKHGRADGLAALLEACAEAGVQLLPPCPVPALHHACAAGSPECVRALLAGPHVRVDLRAVDPLGRSALHAAAAADSPPCLALVLAARPDLLDQADFSGRTALHAACAAGAPQAAAALVEAGALSLLDVDGRLPIHLAALAGSDPCVALTADAYGGEDVADLQGETPLSLAAIEGHVSVVALLYWRCPASSMSPLKALRDATRLGRAAVTSFLLGAGVSPTVPLPESMSPEGEGLLHVAAECGHVGLVEALLDGNGGGGGGASGDVDQRDARGRTALHYACLFHRTRAAEALLIRGASAAAVDGEGATPLHLACDEAAGEPCSGCIGLLLASGGVSPRAVDRHGGTALHRAAAANSAEAAILLLDADPGLVATRDADECTPLHVAAASGSLAALEALLSSPGRLPADWSADPAVGGTTALHLACSNGQAPCVEALCRAGASLAAVDDEGNTALHLAAVSGDLPTVDTLLRAGAVCTVRNADSLTPLHSAIAAGHTAAARVILDRMLRSAMVALHPQPLASPRKAELYSSPPHKSTRAGAAAVGVGLHGVSLAAFAGARKQVPFLEVLGSLGVRLPGGDPLVTLTMHDAAGTGATEVVRALASLGAPVGAPHQLSGEATPLHFAAALGRAAAAAALLDLGAAPDPVDGDGRSPLHLAALGGHLALVTLLLAAGAKASRADAGGRTPLHMAAGADSGADAAACVTRLAATADVNALDLQARAPLHHAGANDRPLAVAALARLGAAVDPRDAHGMTPLVLAAHMGARAACEALLQAGASLLSVDEYRCSALHHAAKLARLDVLRSLLAAAMAPAPLTRTAAVALVCAADVAGWTALHYAAEAGEPEAVTALLDCGADPRARSHTGETALLLGAQAGSAACVEALLVSERGDREHVDQRHPMRRGLTALCIAAAAGNAPLVRVLGLRGANVDLRDDEGLPPVVHAAQAGSLECLVLLHGLRADLGVRDPAGATLTHHAAVAGHLEILDWLAGVGLSLTARATGGLTPLLAAAKEGKNDVIAHLLALPEEAGGTVGDADDAGETALHHAARAGRPETVELLLKLGASVNAASHTGTTPVLAAIEAGDTVISEILLHAGARLD